MESEESRGIMDSKIPPRQPLILANIPKNYYTDNQLAAVIQSIEAALFSVCFRSYPQAFSTMYSGMEKLCKNICSAKKNEKKSFKFYWEETGKRLQLLDHPIFSKWRNAADDEVFTHQSKWTKLRNEVEHQGDSPSYDAQASILLLGSLWDAFELLLAEHHGYNLRSSLMPETERALKLTKKVLDSVKDDERRTTLFFDKPLVCQMRRLVQPTFQDWGFDYERHFNSNARFEDFMQWRREIEQARPELEWRECVCPVCGSPHSILGFCDQGDDETLILKFENFCCPECGFLCFPYDKEPHLGELSLSHSLEGLLPEIMKDCGVNEAITRW